jgi:hypothetical protein
MYLSRNVGGPWIFVDELIYSELGRSAFHGFSIRELPVNGYGNVYPFLIAPAYEVFTSLVTAYEVVKFINSAVMSLTAIPAYFLARTLMTRGWALVASALAVIVPSMAYTGVVMTESAFYPAFVLALMMMVYTLQKPTLLRQVLIFASIGLCYETRPQGAIIGPAYLASVALLIVLDAILSDRGQRIREVGRGLKRFLLTWIITVSGLIAFVALQRSRGVGLGSLLGAYAITTEYRDRYQPKPIVAWFLLHVGELQLWLGVMPFIAFLVLIGIALTRTGDRNLRIFACAAVPVMLLMTALVAAFVVFANVTRVEERNLFYIGVLPLIALCWWASTGFERRQPRWVVVAIVLSVMGPIALPYELLLSGSAVSDTFGVFVPYAVQSRLLDPTFTPFIVGGLMLIPIVVLVTVSARRAYAVVAVVALFLLVTGAAVDRRTDKASAAATAISTPQNWVDAAVGSNADVAVVFMGGADPMRVWQAEFFNRSLGPVYTLFAPLAGGLPDTVVNLHPDGKMVDRQEGAVESDYVLTDSLTKIAGQVVAEDKRFGMVLVRTGGQVVVEQTVAGVYNDGWSGADVTFTQYGCSGGTVTMLANSNNSIHVDPVTVTPYLGDTALSPTQVVGAPEPTAVTARAPAAGGTCQVRFHIEPLVAPSDAIGTTDTRPLGLLIAGFQYTPNR